MRKFLSWLFLPVYHRREMTPKEKRKLTRQIYFLAAGYMYYSTKNFIRDQEQGPFYWGDWFSEKFPNRTTRHTFGNLNLIYDHVRKLSDLTLQAEIDRMKNQLHAQPKVTWTNEEHEFYTALRNEYEFRASGLTEEEWDQQQNWNRTPF